MKPYIRVCAEINLDAAAYNFRSMKNNLAEGTKIIAVVKTDGYGHGAVPIARMVEEYDYIWGFAVATAEEALLLRRADIQKPILILGFVFPDAYEDLVRHDIRPAVFTLQAARQLSEEAVRQEKTVHVHMKVDTGMSRIGLTDDERGAGIVKEVSLLPNLKIEGLFTHFARADEKDKTSAKEQLDCYLRFVDLLEKQGIRIPVKHCANSAAILDMPETGLDQVRAGISIYGMYPSDQVERTRTELRPAMALKSFVTYVKEVEPGRQVSYGGTFTAKRPMRIATIPVGYGDGYPRNLSGRGYVLIQGQRVPILGRVCMDQMMVDVTGLDQVQADTEVILIGADGTERIWVEDLAEWGGGFHYEIVCNIGKRVPRVYRQHGKIVGTKDYFDDKYGDFGDNW